MTKIKHPHNRAERLARKKLENEHKKPRAPVRRIKESLKEEETEHELREISYR
jgi:hypothetical protein